jgi:uroporphyrinogen decarboxylase
VGDVTVEVRRRIRDLAPGGGFVLSAVHCIQPDVPPVNILAMAEAAKGAAARQSEKGCTNTMMKHRDRVLMALHHEAPDRCPMQISFTPEFASRLQMDLLHKSGSSHNRHGGGNTYELERALGEDVLLTSVGWANSYYLEAGSYTDEWGIEWKQCGYITRYGKGSYTEISGRPLADDRALGNYRPPDPHRSELYQDAALAIQAFKGEYWIVGVTVTTIFETAWALRGLERLLMDFALDPEMAERILDIPYQYHLTAAKKLVQMGVDMIWVGDDVGAQGAMMISPQCWRKFLKPRMAAFISEIKALNPQLKVAYHSDGMITPIIPELIEIGVDVLNPIQPACMDPAEIKRQYGDKLCFWGSIDEQRTLPFGTPGDVQREILQRLNTIGRNGGLILAPTHHVQLDTPLENFWAMHRTITETPYASLEGI